MSLNCTQQNFLMVISPAKNLNERPLKTDWQQHSDWLPSQFAQPKLLEQSKILMSELQKLAPHELSNLMSISDKIALLNFERNQTWHTPFTPENAKSALYLFDGDVYDGIGALERTEQEIQYLQQSLRILSGLYGLLKPLDLIQAYRLEMGTALKNCRGANLYEFWENRISDYLNDELNGRILVNLASQEYFKSVQSAKSVQSNYTITPIFKDKKQGGDYKIVSFYAKRARGLMVKYSAINQIQSVDELKGFDLEGYSFNEAYSNEFEWVFLREHK